MTGSKARGCFYFFRTGLNSTTGFIERENTMGELVNLSSHEDISRAQFLVFDWEQDNSTTGGIYIEGSTSAVEHCPPIGQSFKP